MIRGKPPGADSIWWRGFAVGIVKRWSAILMAGVALIIVLPQPSARAQSDEGDVITLDDDAANNSADDAGDAGVDADGATKLKRLVIGADAGRSDITNTPAAVSSMSMEEFKERYAGDTNAALRSTPGAYTREQAEQPGIIVNVRGMQGMGRVNTMIDGVPQTFRNLSGHGGTFDNIAYVDPNMLAGVDINRGAVAGNDGLGTLSGSANLRTIGIDDVLFDGMTYGGVQTIQLGTNGRNFSRLTAAGWHHPLDGDGGVSIMGAISGSNFGNYQNGDGVDYPYNASQQPQSGLVKFGFAPDGEQSLQLGGIWYKNAFAVESAGYDWQINNQTYTAKYAYQPGDNFIDLKISAYANITDVKQSGDGGEFDGRNGTDTGLGLDIANTSTWTIDDATNVRFDYGAAINSDGYKGNDARGANPDGRLIKSGAFLDATLTHGMFGVTGGLRYDAWHLSGITEYIEPGDAGCAASHDGLCAGPELNRNGGNWNPKIGATITPRDWLQFYATYAYTMRPPTAAEMFYPGGHNFDGTGDPINNNPDLVPERQKGLDIGVNLRSDDVFLPGDNAYAKIGFFRNRISNYITYAYDDAGEAKWVNLPGMTTMQGVELAGGYDMGRAYANVSLTLANTGQPTPVGAGFGNDVGTLPDDFATIDVGTRFFEQKLTLGGRVRYTGSSIQVLLDQADQMTRPAYTLVDLYGSYKFSETFRAFFSVENLMNKSYWTANSGTSDMFTGITNGRGRTIMVGATARF
jgi:hemoglobin/transferrin/lactoferrin receptor protein